MGHGTLKLKILPPSGTEHSGDWGDKMEWGEKGRRWGERKVTGEYCLLELGSVSGCRSGRLESEEDRVIID